MKIAVLLHLAYIEQWDEIERYLQHVSRPFDLYVSLVKGLYPDRELDRCRQAVQRAYPAGSVILADNIGADLGGLFQVLLHMGERLSAYDMFIKVHTKGDERWRRKMLDAVLPVPAVFERACRYFEQNQNVGMFGSYLYPYDYYNLEYVIHYCNELGVDINVSWDHYRTKHGMPVDCSVDELIAHSLEHGFLEDRPEIDVEYFQQRYGSTDRQFQAGDLDAFREKGLLGKLPYYPGTMFWIRASIIRGLVSAIDLKRLLGELESGYDKDEQAQTRTHAWERIIPIYAVKSGYLLAAS